MTVDQTKSPVGTLNGSTQFQELGDYFPSSGTLTVVLNASSANGTVVADAVGIAKGWSTGGGQSTYETNPRTSRRSKALALGRFPTCLPTGPAIPE